MHDTVYGLDFGTSNSAVAILENDKPIILPIGLGGELSMPSLLFFSDRRHVAIGDRAVSEYVESGMKGRLLQSIKSFVPHPSFSGTVIFGHGHYGIEDLLALIIREVKRRADVIVGHDVKRVVMGKPAFFSHNPKEDSLAESRLHEAAIRAGFAEIRFQQEPVAAAYCYEATLSRSELVFVVDIGGGTSDVTVISLSPERKHALDRAQDILAVDNVYVGGDNFDSEVMRHKLLDYFGASIKYFNGRQWLTMPAHMMRNICQWRTIPLLRERRTKEFLSKLLVTADDKEAIRRLSSLINNDLGFALFRSIEQAKCDLSCRDESSVVFAHEPDIRINEPITRAQFNTAISDELSRIDSCINDTLAAVGVSPSKIDAAFLTGGGSQTLAIRELLTERFGASKIKTGDSFLSVAAGLALSSKLFFHL